MESETGGPFSLEMKDLHRSEEIAKRRSTEALVLPLHDSLDSNNRQRCIPYSNPAFKMLSVVSFSTPKKNGRGGYDDDDDFQIFEQHQVV